jgi:VWFA-related protein
MVTDANGKPVTNLTREDFSIFEDGTPQSIQSFASVDSPYSILLLIDRSQSMQPHWSWVEPALSRFVGQLKPQDRLSIGAFDERSERVEVLLDWRETRGSSLQIAINPVIRAEYEYQSGSLAAGQSAVVRPRQKDIYAALQWAAKSLTPIASRKAAIVFTDGRQPGTPMRREVASGGPQPRLQDAKDDGDFQSIVRSVQNSRGSFYFVGVNTDLNPNDGRFTMETVNMGMPVRLRLEQLATATGGRVLLPRRLQDTPLFYEQIARDLGTAYTLSYAPTTSSRTSAGVHRIEVRLRNAALRVRQSRDSYLLRQN